jgi:elongation factor P
LAAVVLTGGGTDPNLCARFNPKRLDVERVMYSASDLRKGLRIEIDGAPYIVTEFRFNKPGKGQSIYNCKLKNMLTGSTMSKSYRSNDKMDKPALSERPLMYSYEDSGQYIFMDENYEQLELTPEILGDMRLFLEEDMKVDVLFFNGAPVGVTLPIFVVKVIEFTEPGAHGNTATNVLKPATVTGGYEVNVPIFINQGDTIRIDTRTGDYSERVATA